LLKIKPDKTDLGYPIVNLGVISSDSVFPTLEVENSEIFSIGNLEQNTSLHNVAIIVKGSSTLRTYNVELGQVIASTSSSGEAGNCMLDVQGKTSVTQHIVLGSIVVGAPFEVHQSVELTVSDCVFSTNQITINGFLACSNTIYLQYSNYTIVRGTLLAPDMSMIGGGLKLAHDGMVNVPTINFHNGHLDVLGTSYVGSHDVYIASSNVSLAAAHSLKIAGNLEITNSLFNINIDGEQAAASDMIQVSGNLKVNGAKFVVTASKLPTKRTVFYVMRSTLDIIGSVDVVTELVGSAAGDTVTLYLPRKNQLAIEFTPAEPPPSPTVLPVWVWVFLTLPIIGGVVGFFVYRQVTKRRKGYERFDSPMFAL